MAPENLEILAYETTPLGDLCLRRRRLLSENDTVVTEITLNHEFLMSSLYTDSERALATEGLAMHRGAGLDVLVGGLGLGYTAHAVLESERVRRLVAIELLAPVLDWLREGLVPLSDELNADARFSAVAADVYALLQNPPKEKFDLILIDVDHSPDEHLDTANQPFYSRKGLASAKLHLKPGGILGIWSFAESSPFADALKSVFEKVRLVPVTFENAHLDEKRTDWIFLAGA